MTVFDFGPFCRTEEGREAVEDGTFPRRDELLDGGADLMYTVDSFLVICFNKRARLFECLKTAKTYVSMDDGWVIGYLLPVQNHRRLSLLQ